MAPHPRVGVVTGANKGIGYALLRQIALQWPESPMNDGPLMLYLTSRNEERGQKALASIHQDEALKKAKALKADGGWTEIVFHQLDIEKPESIHGFRDFLKQKHPEGIDFVVNNAGVYVDGADVKAVDACLGCNYYGTVQATEELLPLLKPDQDSRMVNICSMAGSVVYQGPELHERIRSSAASVEEANKLMEYFREAAKQGDFKGTGWQDSAYCASKCGAIAATKAIAEREKKKGSKALINACCVGVVDTDLILNVPNMPDKLKQNMKTPDQGTATPLMLAIRDIQGKTGEYWQDEKVAVW